MTLKGIPTHWAYRVIPPAGITTTSVLAADTPVPFGSVDQPTNANVARVGTVALMVTVSSVSAFWLLGAPVPPLAS